MEKKKERKQEKEKEKEQRYNGKTRQWQCLTLVLMYSKSVSHWSSGIPVLSIMASREIRREPLLRKVRYAEGESGRLERGGVYLCHRGA